MFLLYFMHKQGATVAFYENNKTDQLAVFNQNHRVALFAHKTKQKQSSTWSLFSFLNRNVLKQQHVFAAVFMLS